MPLLGVFREPFNCSLELALGAMEHANFAFRIGDARALGFLKETPVRDRAKSDLMNGKETAPKAARTIFVRSAATAGPCFRRFHHCTPHPEMLENIGDGALNKM